MSKKIESHGFIANWNKIINSSNREECEKDNNYKAKLMAEDHKKYSNSSVEVKVDEAVYLSKGMFDDLFDVIKDINTPLVTETLIVQDLEFQSMFNNK